MSIPGSASPLFFTAAADAAAAGPIKSVRINSADNAKLTRTPSSAGNRKTWTWAGWVKLNKSSSNFFLGAGTTGTTNYTYARFGVYLDKIQFLTYGQFIFTSDAVFRDYSGWGHITLVCDTTESTAADRLKVYWNGVQLTNSATTTLDSDGEYAFNNTLPHTIGSESTFGTWDGYLADLYFIDGQALDPTSFGAFDDNGVWQAATYSGTYGTNGYHLLDFANESGIGNDSSGNDNDFTVNNISVDTASLNVNLYSPTVTSTLYGGTEAAVLNSTNLNDYAQIATPNYGTYFWQLELSTSIPITSSVKINMESGGGTLGNFVVRLNDNSSTDTSLPVTGGRQTVTLNLDTETSLTKFRLSSPSGSGFGTYLYYIMVDDVVLTKGLISTANHDVLRDVPTNGDSSDGTGAGGEVSGNYCTLNPLQNIANDTFSQGNLQVATNTSNYGTYTSTMATPLSGKWYAEVDIVSESGYTFVGLCSASSFPFTTTKSLYNHDSVAYYGRNGDRWIDGSSAAYGATYTTGDIIGIAYDADAGSVAFYKNGSSQGTITSVPVREYFFAGSDFDGGSSCTYVWNFGQRGFAYSAPSGYKALCTTNLPTPTIADGSDHFDAALWTGNGTSQSITGLEFSPDLVWVKGRNAANGHNLQNTISGTGKFLQSHTNSGEGSSTTKITAFNSDGFSVGSNAGVNDNNDTYVGWAWKAAGSAVSNSDGSITTSVRANATAGFSLVSYTSTGGSSATIGHGLNAAPDFVLCKRLDTAGDWWAGHVGAGWTKGAYLQVDDSFDTNSNWWNDTAPTSSVVTLGSYPLTGSSGSYIAFCFTSVAEYSKFGKYSGNSSDNGPFIYTGFRPRWIMIKGENYDREWAIIDTARDTVNPLDTILKANAADAEATSSNYYVDALSNGFKIRTATHPFNAGYDYIYAAFAENPFQANGGLAR